MYFACLSWLLTENIVTSTVSLKHDFIIYLWEFIKNFVRYATYVRYLLCGIINGIHSFNLICMPNFCFPKSWITKWSDHYIVSHPSFGGGGGLESDFYTREILVGGGMEIETTPNTSMVTGRETTQFSSQIF